MLKQLNRAEREALAALKNLDDEEHLLQWRAQYLGKKSPVMEAFTVMRELSKEERPLVGRRANEVRQALEEALEERREALKRRELLSALETEKLDVTLPGKPKNIGRLHPVTQTMRRIYRIFGDMGFQIYRSREVETDDYNFTFLNMPAHHPARDMWDTFYTEQEGIILRTHTSPGQIHAMREYHPEPIRVFLPGMCYRILLAVCSRPMCAPVSVPRISPSLNPAPRWMWNASFAAAKAVRCASTPAGWKFWAVGWCTRTCCALADMIPLR